MSSFTAFLFRPINPYLAIGIITVLSSTLIVSMERAVAAVERDFDEVALLYATQETRVHTARTSANNTTQTTHEAGAQSEGDTKGE